MTVAIAGNFTDGVVLGVDSAVTLAQGNIVYKVYENAEKLFQLGEKSIGLAAFGMAAIGGRGIGSYIREFELKDPGGVVNGSHGIQEIVEEMRSFFVGLYQATVVPQVEAETKKKFHELPDDKKPLLGLAIGGFSGKEPFSEIWEIRIPLNDTPNSARQLCAPGQFRTAWFALNEPIHRYIKGIDRGLLKELKEHIGTMRTSPLTNTEEAAIDAIVAKHEYPIPFPGMPLQEGIAHVRFLVEMVINHHRFAVGAPVVGGKARIGVVTYKGEKFRILEEGN